MSMKTWEDFNDRVVRVWRIAARDYNDELRELAECVDFLGKRIIDERQEREVHAQAGAGVRSGRADAVRGGSNEPAKANSKESGDVGRLPEGLPKTCS